MWEIHNIYAPSGWTRGFRAQDARRERARYARRRAVERADAIYRRDKDDALLPEYIDYYAEFFGPAVYAAPRVVLLPEYIDDDLDFPDDDAGFEF